MSKNINALAAKLRLLIPEWGPEATRAIFEIQCAALNAEERQRLEELVFDNHNAVGITHDDKATAASSQQGIVHIADHATVCGPNVGLNLGTIIYGRVLRDDEQRRLIWYLERIAARLYHLHLRGIEEQFDHGDGLALPRVYTTLATTHTVIFASGTPNEIEDYCNVEDIEVPFTSDTHNSTWKVTVKETYSPNQALPHEAIMDVDVSDGAQRVDLVRQLLVTEAVEQHQHLVLLGDPGSGKSTFIRHLAWAIAMHSLDISNDMTRMVGWNDKQRLLPIILPLRILAERLAREGTSVVTVSAALRDEMEQYDLLEVNDLLSEALHSGVLILFLDGLDEVPLHQTPNLVDRKTTLQAVHNFARLHPKSRIIVTCRTYAFDMELRELLAWPVEIISPFSLGQIRHFVSAWYNELLFKGQIDILKKDRLEQALINTITTSPKLHQMAQTPLLLTMMVLVLYNKGELPRDRPQLYERILELLLGQWDKVHEGQNIAEAIGQPNWSSERLRPVLDRLSYEAHIRAQSKDGRGSLQRGDVFTALIDFFKQARLPDAGNAALRCLDYFEQRSGLLLADEKDSYCFAHLTLQEHCAGRHLLLHRNAPALIMERRMDDRWREPIFLGLGVVQQTKPEIIDRILADLIDREEYGHEKSVTRWYRDLILAAEIGQDRDWNYLRTQQVNVDRLQRDLRRSLIILLQDKAQPLPTAERVQAGFQLGHLGDSRYPVTIEQWKRELIRAMQGDTNGYFCQVEAGNYVIGSAENDSDADDSEKPQHTVIIAPSFFIGRYPITNDQWQEWVAAGGQSSFSKDEAQLSHRNQPVVSVSWYRCNDFCSWLSEQLTEVLPQDMVLRLPTEYEWEAAARGMDAVRRYPWGEIWGDQYAASKEDREVRDWHWTVPVGCYPAGASQCGAFDMAGNVWEWILNEKKSYPEARELFIDGSWRVQRGGGYSSSRSNLRCAARRWTRPNVSSGYGFRIVVAQETARI